MKSSVGALLLILSVVFASVSGTWQIACLCAASCVGYAALRVFTLTKHALASKHWPTAATQRVRARVEDTEDLNDDTSTRTLKVRYRYVVDGVSYQGHRLRFPFGIVPSVESMPAQARQLHGKRSVVHHHPRRHEISVLQPGLSWLDGFALAIFMACAVPFFFVLFMFGIGAWPSPW